MITQILIPLIIRNFFSV